MMWACGNDSTNEPQHPTLQEFVKPVDKTPIQLTRGEEKIVAGSNSFAFGLISQFSTNLRTDNCIISPYSLTHLLGMAANGASQEAADEILSVICDGATLEELNALNYKTAFRLPNQDEHASVSVSNLLWLNSQYKVCPAFGKVLNDLYGAEVLQSPPNQAYDAVDGWTVRNSNGLLHADILPLKDFLLSNIVYFKNCWTVPFISELTKVAPFTNIDGTEAEVDMMRLGIETAYGAFEDFKVLNLPYGNRSFNFYVLMPAKLKFPKNLYDFTGTLTAERWNEMKAEMKEESVDITLPKFSLSFKFGQFEYPLAAMGIRRLFADQDALCSIAQNKTDFAAPVVEQTVVFSIDEDGSEAVGKSDMFPFTWDGSSHEVEWVDFVCDQPFMFIVEEKNTNVMLFMGLVTKL